MVAQVIPVKFNATDDEDWYGNEPTTDEGWDDEDEYPVQTIIVTDSALDLVYSYPRQRRPIDTFITYIAAVIAGWGMCMVGAHFIASLANR